MIKAILITLSLTTTFLFFIYGYNCYYLLKHARRYRAPQSRRCHQLPRVAIHLPIYNEKYVVHRLVDACAKMAEEYSRERVRIMLLDDSDDETAQVVTEVAQHYSAQGFKVTVIRRGDRQGFKAGALQNALKQTEEEYIAVFDADFIPPPNFLTSTIPYLVEDERLAVVQCRWGHVNRGYNFITRMNP